MNRPPRQPELWLGIGVVIAAIVTLGFIGFLTRTDRGRAEVLAFTLSAVGGQLNGTLIVERLEGSLLAGATIYGVSLIDEQEEPLLRADSGYLEYETATLVGGDVVINDLVLYGADIFLHRMPRDSLWNYQAVLADTTPSDTGRVARATLIESIRLVNTVVTVRTPWEPDEEVSAEDAMADTSRLVVERVPGGYLRTMSFALAEARASDLVIAPDERGGTYVRVDTAAGEIRVWRDPPLTLTDLQGQVAFSDELVRLTFDRAGIGGSVLTGGGTIRLGGDRPRYDLVLRGTRVALADLRWLYPPIPEEGSIGGEILLETRPEGLYFAARDALLQTPDTRIAGSFGMVAGDTLRFTEVDLRAAPLRVETVQRLLPGSTPIEGLRIGSAVIESPPGP